MAEAQDQIINRLQQHRHRIPRMLIPGSKAPARGVSIGRLSSIFNQAGAGRFKLAAQKMRTLDKTKLGTLQPGLLKDFSRGIPDKFREVQDLIHLTPKYKGDTSIWSILERTLPNQGGVGFEAPSQPGTLGPGSVIQQFSMVPKPGQSLEAFAEQVKSITSPKKFGGPTKPPRLSPKSRLYTSVQEITDQDIQDTPASEGADTLDEKPAADTQTPEAGAVQRQIESLPPVEVLEPEIIVDDTSEDLPETQVTEQGKPPSPQPLPKAAKPAKVKPRTELEIRELPKAKPAAEKAEFIPGKPDLPKAKPISTVTHLVQRAVAAPVHPRAGKPRPTPGITTQPRVQTPRLKQILEIIPKGKAVISPRPEPDAAILPTPPPTPRIDDVQPPPTELRRAAASAPPPEMKGEAKPIPAQLDSQARKPLEIPLQGKIEAQRKATQTFKSLAPEAITPPKEPPLLTRLEKPLVPTQKYRPTAIPEGRPIKATPTGQEISRDAPFMPEIDILKSLESRLSPASQLEPGWFTQDEVRPSPLIEPLALPMAYPIPPGPPQQRPPIQPITPEQPLLQPPPAESQLLQPKPEGELLPQPTPELEYEMPDLTPIPWDKTSQIDTKDTIRRVIEEPEVVDDDEPEPEEIDLEQLAEDVLPLVKRILEIESERLASNLK